jgi:hypothetical protein
MDWGFLATCCCCCCKSKDHDDEADRMQLLHELSVPLRVRVRDPEDASWGIRKVEALRRGEEGQELPSFWTWTIRDYCFL